MVANNVLNLIGNTPLVRIRRLTGENDATILAKLEMFNLSGSVKDRLVKYIVEDAERAGILRKGSVIVEATSGNTGIALSVIGCIKGYKVKVVLPKSASEERKRIIRSLDAELILADDEYEAIRLADKLSRENGWYLLNQFGNILNVEAHYKTTGRELWEQSGGNLDAFVAGIGTGGTIMGVGKRLKENKPEIKVIGCEPDLDTKIEGMLNFTDSNYKPPILDLELVDELVRVKDEDALEMTRAIARKEGLFVGISSGAVLHAALTKAKDLGKEKTIAVVFADGGGRYLSTQAFAK
jgi:cysteine synthase A